MLRQGSSGSATVENIFWLPVLLLIIGAVSQFGVYMLARSAVQGAAYEGARQASTADEPKTAAEETAAAYLEGILPVAGNDQMAQVTIKTDSGQVPGEPIVVRVDYKVPVLLPKAASFFGGGNETIAVSGIARTTIEEKP